MAQSQGPSKGIFWRDTTLPLSTTSATAATAAIDAQPAAPQLTSHVMNATGGWRSVDLAGSGTGQYGGPACALLLLGYGRCNTCDGKARVP